MPTSLQLHNENQCVVPNQHLSCQIHRQLPQLQECNLYEIFAIFGELHSTKTMTKLGNNLKAHLSSGSFLTKRFQML